VSRFADVAARRRVTDDSLFAIASGSKPITAMAIFKLIDDGKIALETTAFPYLGLHAKDGRFAHITIAQLLNHSSGLKSDVRVASNDPLDVAKAALASKLLFTPGQKQAYSNTAFNVLGAVIQKASGQEYRAYVQQNIFAPAGVMDAVALERRVLRRRFGRRLPRSVGPTRLREERRNHRRLLVDGTCRKRCGVRGALQRRRER
jgi:CubicO group peptidase (beta-lactamase class C family)